MSKRKTSPLLNVRMVSSKVVKGIRMEVRADSSAFPVFPVGVVFPAVVRVADQADFPA